MIDTPRLRLEPHHPHLLLALIESVERFEQASGLRATPGLREFFVSGEASPAFLDALRTADEADPWLYGFAVIHRDSSTVIGTGGLKGEPDEDGVAEIAYGIVPSFESRGYATEVAEALSRFAASDPRTRVLRAHTLPEANASTRVLRKTGFFFVGEVIDPEDGRVWRWDRHPSLMLFTDSARMDVDAIHRFLSEESYWAKGIPREIVAKAIANSVCFGVFDGDRQVAFARVITDRATYGYLADVYVETEYRGRGISRWIMKAIDGHAELQGFRRWSLVTRDAHRIYAANGYVPVAEPSRHMERVTKGGYEIPTDSRPSS